MSPRLTFVLTWSGLSEALASQAPQEAMKFGGTLRLIIQHILEEDPLLGPVYIRKVDLADAYMRLWVHLEDTPVTELLIPRKSPEDPQLAVF